MKKFFQFLAALIGIAIVVMAVLGIVEPKDVVVTRSLLIKAPTDVVFDQMVNFKNWTNWSPWYKMDSTMKITYSGTDGQVGSSYSWVGSDKTGSGEMINNGVFGKKMDFEIKFTEPHSGHADATLIATDSAGMTIATWTVTMHTAFPKNAMNAFINMDKILGGDFESGLNNMKQYVENHVQASSTLDLQNGVYQAHVFEGVRQIVKPDDIQRFYMDNCVMLKKSLGDKINGPSVEILYALDTATGHMDLAVGFPVSDTSVVPKGAQVIHINDSKAYKVTQKGDYAKFPEVHVAIQRYMGSQKQRPALIFEEYVIGPVETQDSTKWLTNIYYLVK